MGGTEKKGKNKGERHMNLGKMLISFPVFLILQKKN